jgi:hypothetical protein
MLKNPHSIPLHEASAMTKRFRENRDSILNQEYLGKDILPLCETFSKDAFTSFFNNPSVKKLRVYYGMSENLQIHAIIVGVNENNEDMLPIETTSNASSTEAPDPIEILEDSERCPPLCPPPSDLNQP